jgi:hypothetical protein
MALPTIHVHFPNGTVRQVLWSEDQPRDEHGRWTGGGDTTSKNAGHIAAIKEGIKAPRVSAHVDYLNGAQRPSTTITVSLDNPNDRIGRSMKTILDANGKLIHISGYNMPHMGATQTSSTADAIAKINAHLAKVKK